MKFFVEPTNPPQDKRPYIRHLAWLLAGVLIVLALSQLFAFEKFVPLVESFWLPGGKPAAYLVASLIGVSEVFALPFLLGMRLSPAMRSISAALAVLAPALWLYIALWLNLTTNAVSNIGILGTSLPLPVGWWAVFLVAALLILAIWVVWGRWPLAHAKGRAVGQKG